MIGLRFNTFEYIIYVHEIRQKPFRMENDASPLNVSTLDINFSLKRTDINTIEASYT